ncbi:MAG: alpha/beta hydrolase [Hyphomicrobiaceae bacterium]|nr:alpha/beta hydrolase [Hyphomicrobiaceae bacterium]
MRAADVELLIVPGWSGSGPDHWQSRWARHFQTARVVEQEDWFAPDLESWTQRLMEAVGQAARPVILIGHSLGVATIVHAARALPPEKVAGAFLVAPADVDNAARWPVTQGYTFDASTGFAPLPRGPIPFPAVLVASGSDPYCSLGRARELASAWGAALVEAGDLGHINVASGHGPWPEGILRLGFFLQALGPAGSRARASDG